VKMEKHTALLMLLLVVGVFCFSGCMGTTKNMNGYLMIGKAPVQTDNISYIEMRYTHMMMSEHYSFSIYKTDDNTYHVTGRFYEPEPQTQTIREYDIDVYTDEEPLRALAEQVGGIEIPFTTQEPRKSSHIVLDAPSYMFYVSTEDEKNYYLQPGKEDNETIKAAWKEILKGLEKTK